MQEQEFQNSVLFRMCTYIIVKASLKRFSLLLLSYLQIFSTHTHPLPAAKKTNFTEFLSPS